MACSATVTGTLTTNCAARYTGASCLADGCCDWNARNEICSKLTCATMEDNSPDACKGCVTCPGTWTISNARAASRWAITVTGQTVVTSTGSHSFQYKLTTAGFRKAASALSVKFKPGLGHKLK